ncbi:MAG: hypothetical protein KAS32_16930 [Candidatus Peribacteraceae bacterium]|nr:hypothetical protein [Candidatus Peribacteraceae bacterium]
MENSDREILSFKMAQESINKTCFKRFLEKAKEGRSGWETATPTDLMAGGFKKLIQSTHSFGSNERKKNLTDAINYLIMSYDADFNDENYTEVRENSPEDTIKLIDAVISILTKEKKEILEEQFSAISKS